jgi:hypothetical protein
MSNTTKIINKGTGAGGANTTKNGMAFECLTSNALRLEDLGFTKTLVGKGKTMFTLSKSYEDEDKTITFASKHGFKKLIKTLFNVDLYREPDEAYVVHYKATNQYIIMIVEKKNQNCEGSVEEKLFTGAFIRRLYQKRFKDHPNVQVHYAFCVSDFLTNHLTSTKEKYLDISEILVEDNIKVFHSKDSDFVEQVDAWIGI